MRAREVRVVEPLADGRLSSAGYAVGLLTSWQQIGMQERIGMGVADLGAMVDS